ncbi:MAG: TetR/AcrR family transcriptional regulator [Atopobiaceae bacterium]|jgi:AcrR family transcriptional regulator|nr:TetR/AcrR family transcriptional regulator [Atopobiaceae bacterium]MCH4213690.1 TetR/AcrR family transcriptional regulator [Atopobiaceae bacterium]MCH4275953.1 TetR/AcrR family transcriptional regulator [Atopobiaceae bacterium]MCI1225710.1 TetR/AcrR family transcriptional regulator [Atopobiaceae bacterium]MCI1260344.1 TetR/AcrR family transcriptional regulator [Atopobiaceae bacterium]
MQRKLSRTRRDIIVALLELLKTNSLAEITITQIAQEAKVARRTFYLNYQNKEGVMKDYIEVLFDEFSRSLQTAGSRDSRHDTIAFFRFWKEHREFLLLLQRNSLLNLLLDEYEQMLEETTLFSIENVMEKDVGAKQMRYVRVVLAASLMGMLLEWVESGFREEPEELAEVMENMMYHRKQE